MATKSVEVILSAVKSAGEAALRLHAENAALKTRLAECEADRLEQCRLNGMGSEREAHLLARVDEAERLLRECGPWLPKEYRGQGYSDFLARLVMFLGIEQGTNTPFPHPGFVTDEDMNRRFSTAVTVTDSQPT